MKCIFVGYSEDIKGYRLLQPNSKGIIIRRDVRFNENVLACKPYLAVVSFSYSLLDNTPSDISSDTNIDDEHPPPPVSPPAPAPLATSQLPHWVHSTCEVAGDLAGDPRGQHQTRS